MLNIVGHILFSTYPTHYIGHMSFVPFVAEVEPILLEWENNCRMGYFVMFGAEILR